MSSWYFVKDGDRSGPVTRAELDARVAEGQVDSETLVWRVGMGAWAAAGTITELGLPPPRPQSSGAPRPDEEEEADTVVEPGPTATRIPPAVATTVTGDTGAAPRRARLEYAGFRLRLAAKLVDLVILYGIALLVEGGVARLYFDGIVPLMLEDWDKWVDFARIAVPVNLVIVLAYSVYFIRTHEATPGKRMLGLRLVRADGGRLGAGRVIGRYFAEQVSGLVFLAGYIMAAFDEEKRTLHDYLCDTRVVRGARDEEH